MHLMPAEMHLRCEGVPPAAKILVPSEMHLKPEEVHLAAPKRLEPAERHLKPEYSRRPCRLVK
jgi:hypothetical protein